MKMFQINDTIDLKELKRLWDRAYGRRKIERELSGGTEKTEVKGEGKPEEINTNVNVNDVDTNVKVDANV